MAFRESEIIHTIEEYLALERKAEERHEYPNGYIYAMAGGSQAHEDICANLRGILVTQLRGTPCRARIANTKVRSGPAPESAQSRKGLFSYPDLLVVSGEMQFHDKHRDVILNPTVIIEVISKSTERFDRGEKFLRYQLWSPSLSDNVLVSQTEPMIEHYVRLPDGSWKYTIHRGLDRNLRLESISCILNLADVYERVKFTPEESDEPEEEYFEE